MSETQKNNSLQRRAYDVEQGIDEKDDEDEDGDEEGAMTQGTASGTGTGGVMSGVGGGGVGLGMLGSGGLVGVIEQSPLERARAIATSLCHLKGLPVPTIITLPQSLLSNTPTSSSVSLGVDGKIDSRAAMLRAKAIASQLASGGKLGDGVGDLKEAVAHFSEELDINDYPPQVIIGE